VSALDRFTMTGKTAVVTGGGRGLGRAIAVALAEAGADVVVMGRTPRSLEETSAAIEQCGSTATSVVADVSDPEAVEHAFAELTASRPLDVLVNNAGVVVEAPVEKMETHEWRSVVDTNLSGTFYCIRAFVAPAGPDGRAIVNISSLSAAAGVPRQVGYSASKGGVEALTRSLAIELAPRQIRVNALAPGYTDTDMPAAVINDPYLMERVLRRIPLRRFADPSEIASGVLFLASAASSYMTGAVLTLDGGFTAQ
jgi:NAD(P)-dependent dehydrogenase (short-subunit alcohol dehydrogenase family)